MSAIMNTLQRDPLGFGKELLYMTAAMGAVNVAIGYVDHSTIFNYLPDNLKPYSELITKSFHDGLMIKIGQFY